MPENIEVKLVTMFVFNYYITYVLLIIFSFSSCTRRISSGVDVIPERKFIVYFVKSPYSKHNYDSWICGGAIVSPRQIITSAACLVEMENVYAIAGYKWYIKDIDNHECTRERKQKVIKYSIPRGYTLGLNPTDWMYKDIGVAIVEEPYAFYDTSYRLICSYEPGPISLNLNGYLDVHRQLGVTYGWGGQRYRRSSEDQDINSKLLQQAAIYIEDKETCNTYAENLEIPENVRKLLLCGGQIRVSAENGERFDPNLTDFNGDMAGLCQNDHGGPLTEWVGNTEVLIGISLTSLRIEETQLCTKPYFFLNIKAVTDVLKCLLLVTASNISSSDDCDDKITSIDVTWPTRLQRPEKILTNGPDYWKPGNRKDYKKNDPRTVQLFRGKRKLPIKRKINKARISSLNKF